jgi:hypothetical protein
MSGSGDKETQGNHLVLFRCPREGRVTFCCSCSQFDQLYEVYGHTAQLTVTEAHQEMYYSAFKKKKCTVTIPTYAHTLT